MSTPINMIRRDNGSSNDNYPDPKELMRQRLVEPDSNQISQSNMMQQQNQFQQQPPQQFMGDPMMMNEQQHPGMDGIMRTDNQLVEDILKEMGESPGGASQANINSQAFGYAMDRAQIPPHKYVDPSSQSDNNDSDNKLGNGNGSMSATKGSSLSPSGIMNQISFSLNGQNLKSKVTRNYRYPVLVFIICLLLGLPEFNRFLFSFFPKLLLESGQVSLSGVALKALVGMVVFIIIGIFI
uniref:Uncharacterized protein n=1 Tax=viral metagenome TaxID=1070528 RepID=A0A6C0HMY3_9ZZZZ